MTSAALTPCPSPPAKREQGRGAGGEGASGPRIGHAASRSAGFSPSAAVTVATTAGAVAPGSPTLQRASTGSVHALRFLAADAQTRQNERARMRRCRVQCNALLDRSG
uniref:Uncharacterized protein n=1 Tax=uncultured Armatimonadetes bacterium TaxID=157466 RepID=A0A6J4J9Y0_9BACT|nr:hypothetical protein AVDCRST_MAG63-3028 [uncultured Armatimonadetes bacterium]